METLTEYVKQDGELLMEVTEMMSKLVYMHSVSTQWIANKAIYLIKTRQEYPYVVEELKNSTEYQDIYRLVANRKKADSKYRG